MGPGMLGASSDPMHVRYVPRSWYLGFPAVSVALVALALSLVAALRAGQVGIAALSAGAMIGLLVSIAWSLRHYSFVTAGILTVLAASGMSVLGMWHLQAEVVALLAAALVFGTWCAVYYGGVTARANAEHASGVLALGGNGAAGHALIVYHSTHGGFLPAVLFAFAEGLQSQGFRVDVTTASGETPTNLAGYDLLVLGTPAYNWEPSRPILAYLERLGDLRHLPVVVVVSGGGMTERASRRMRARVHEAHGHLLDAIEIWCSRSNVELHGSADAVEILRAAGARLRVRRATRAEAGAVPMPLGAGLSHV